MAIYEKKVILDKSTYNRVVAALNSPDEMGEDDTITVTVKFDNGYEADIKCCGTQDDVAWTEAVLFDGKGSQLAYTEPSDDFLGEWILEYEGDEYRVYLEYEYEFEVSWTARANVKVVAGGLEEAEAKVRRMNTSEFENPRFFPEPEDVFLVSKETLVDAVKALVKSAKKNRKTTG